MAEPIYDRHGIQVFAGDCLDVMRTMPDASVHAVVTDPPAGIRFMNRAWDDDMGGRHSWVAWLSERMAEALRVLKPGGYGLVWAMPRTSHWTAWALEDAGFEIRDCVVHLFGSGFPKSLDVGKAIDKRPGVVRHTEFATHLADRRTAAGLSRQDVSERVVGTRTGACWNWEHHQFPEAKWWPALRDLLDLNPQWDAVIAEAARERTGQAAWSNSAHHFVPGENHAQRVHLDITAPATDAARQWDGFGTALKPAAEHWWLVRKPMAGTVASNVQAYGVGALNINSTRVAASDALVRPAVLRTDNDVLGSGLGAGVQTEPAGRWPANVVLTHSRKCDTDGCDPGWCPVAELDQQSGVLASGSRRAGEHGLMGYMGADVSPMPTVAGDQGGASRFFPQFRWEAKAPTSERPKVGGKAWPTVKPLDLMRWLVRLVTPPGGLVLDLFCGTGTTLHAARAEGFRAVGIDSDPDAIALTISRLDGYREPATVDPATGESEPMDLLDLLDGGAA